jgi:hypothetical protein
MPQHCVIVRTHSNCIVTISRAADGLGVWQAHVLDAREHMHQPAINAASSEKALDQAIAFVDALPDERRQWAPRGATRI